MKKIFIVLTIPLLLFISCNLSDSSSHEVDVAFSPLVGEWTFIKATGGFGGSTITPEFLGYTPRFVVYNSKKANWYKQDSILVSYTVSFEKLDWMEEKG